MEFFIFALGWGVGFYYVMRFRNRKESQKKDEKISRPTSFASHKIWYEVLEVKEFASNDEIKAAYRAKMNDYHPDRFLSLGEDFALLAEERAKEITEAYRFIRNLRKF